MAEPSKALAGGLWRDNPALVPLLGLCPLLAITTSLVNGLALGIATTCVMLATNAIVSSIRHRLAPAVRIMVFVIVIASFVTIVDLLSNAYLHELHEVLGLFIPLIVTNCAILAQAETVASRQALAPSLLAGFTSGLGFTAVLVALGALRELVGRGTLLADLDLLFGPAFAAQPIELPVGGLLIAALPPGAFFGLALLVAGKQYLDARRAAASASSATPADAQ